MPTETKPKAIRLSDGSYQELPRIDLPPDARADQYEPSAPLPMRTLPTGAHRESKKNKGRYDLLSPIALHRLALRYEFGANKYSDRDWERGVPLTELYNSALRHLNQWMLGESDEDHLAAAAFNIFAMMHGEDAITRGIWPEELGEK